VAKYSLEIKQSAQKELDALDDALFSRIDRRILALVDNPRPSGCKKLKGYKDQWRIRIGDYRVIYIIEDSTMITPPHQVRPPLGGRGRSLFHAAPKTVGVQRALKSIPCSSVMPGAPGEDRQSIVATGCLSCQVPISMMFRIAMRTIEGGTACCSDG
jgi:mRNA interferase RelE/StbE